MKAAGAALVVIGCTLYGFIKAAGLSRQAKCLAAFLESLRFIEAELGSTAPPLPELFQRLAKTARPEVRGFYAGLCEGMEGIGDKSLFQLWRQNLFENSALCLSAFQRTELERPGAVLGRYDYREQAGALESCLLRLEPELQAANKRAREGMRLYTGLGLTFGIMAATVML